MKLALLPIEEKTAQTNFLKIDWLFETQFLFAFKKCPVRKYYDILLAKI